MACLENRVKNSLAHLSAFDSKRTEHVRLSPGVSPSKPENIQKLLERIKTFSQLTWFAKPDWLSPVNCARLGWQNVDVDLLECNKCKAVISAKLPSSQNIQVYNECCKRLESLLQNGHHSCCSRKSQPTSSDLCQLTLQNRSVELQDFIGRVKGLIELKSHLPVIEESAFTSLKLTMDDVVPLCHLVADVCPSIADVDQSVLMSACILALCGWNVSTSTSCGELVECKFCNRKIGLWNYFSHNPEFDEETTTTMSGYYDDGDLAENNLGDCTEADLSADAFELAAVAQETDLQLVNEGQELLLGEDTNGVVTGLESERGEDANGGVAGLESEHGEDANEGVTGLESEHGEDANEGVTGLESEHGEDTNGGATGLESKQSIALTDEMNSPEDNNEEEEITGDVQLEVSHELRTTVSHETLVIRSLFNGSENEEIPDEDETRSIEFLTGTVLGTTNVLRTADAFCRAETPVVAEEVTAVQMTSEDGECSVNQETVVLNDAELGVECPNNGSTKCENEGVLSGVEICQEECVIGSVECEEESAGISLVCSVEGFGDIPDLSGSCVVTCNTISSNSFSVFPTQHDSSNAGVGGGGVRDNIDEDSRNRSDEIVMDGKNLGELPEEMNATVSETLPSVSDDLALASDGSKVTDGVYTIGISDELSGSQDVQMDMEDQFPCGTAAEEAATGFDFAAGGILEERSNDVTDKLIESNDNATSCSIIGDLYEVNLFKPAVQPDQPSAQQPDELTTQLPNELPDELIDQPAVQPDQPSTQQLEPTTQPPDELTTQLTNELTDELIEQPTVQPSVQPSTQETDEVPDQLVKEQLDDQAIVTDAVELEANNERDIEPHIQGSMKRTATTAPEFSAKRRRLARPVRGCFNPVAEHRPWCIWVQDLVIKRCPRMSGGNEAEVKDAVHEHPWMRLFHLLLQPHPPDNRDVRRALSLFKSF